MITSKLIEEILIDTAKTWDREILQVARVVREILNLKMEIDREEGCVDLYGSGNYMVITIYWNGPYCAKAIWSDEEGNEGEYRWE